MIRPGTTPITGVVGPVARRDAKSAAVDAAAP